MFSSYSNIFCFLFFLFLNSCNYQMGQGDLSEKYSTFSIPYAEGDQQGELTSEIVKKLSESSSLKYRDSDGDLLLKVKMRDLNNEDIGYRYARKRGGHLKHYLVPTETRLKVEAEITLYDRQGKIIRGPIIIQTAVDFDHTFYTSRNQENVFSLGQLNDIDAAREAAMRPLNVSLADKIVDYLLNSW